MNDITKFIVQDVRCFEGRQDFDIRPITFLVGENSTGKSTVLGCFQILANAINESLFHNKKELIDFNLNFNVEPYQMGVFTDIIKKSDPQKISFQMGFGFQNEENELFEFILTMTEREGGYEPMIHKQTFVFNDVIYDLYPSQIFRQKIRDGNRLDEDISIKSTDEGEKKKFIIKYSSTLTLLDLFFSVRHKEKEISIVEQELRDSLKDKEDRTPSLFYSMNEAVEAVSSFAPIRSEPQRTYNPLSQINSPDGRNIPMQLMNMSKTEEKKWKEIKKQLLDFGKKSGLFTDIGVKTFGKSKGDPFQLQVKANGPKTNLIDVGYGVNQILPILVSILSEQVGSIFLMQQPEVHLHPKGQSELSSLLVQSFKKKKAAICC